MDDIKDFKGQATWDVGVPPIIEPAAEPELWNAAADMPVWTWSQLEDALSELAASRQQHDMIENLVSATRKQARYLPSGHILKEILCIAWVIADETFKGGREEGSSMT
ncbi:hypothetical protein MCEMIH16_00018 [Caulobacteraceae bacterium]|jgi:hypothetical protein